jgi:RNA polymerase sigma factor (TIGR02999 family)
MLQGDREAGEQAVQALYTSLRRIASARLRRERPGHLLETGALVNEAMVRLFGARSVVVNDREHFLALMCLLMKRILIDAGRRKDPIYESLDESMASLDSSGKERMMTVDRVLERFLALDPPAYRVLELKVGAGMTSEEVAEEMSCSVGTVKRGLQRARAWMFKELGPLRREPPPLA